MRANAEFTKVDSDTHLMLLNSIRCKISTCKQIKMEFCNFFSSRVVLALNHMAIVAHSLPATDRGGRFELVERGGGDDECALARPTDAQEPGADDGRVGEQVSKSSM